MRQTVSKIALLLILIGLLVWVGVERVQAHANLVRSVPAANEAVASAPTKIRLWFSEPLERGFSKITLRNASGELIDTLPSQVDLADPLQMFLVPGRLPNGLYTVSWQALSASDGHRTTGNFAFTVGPATGTQSAAVPTTDVIPWDSALIRWLNLLSMALTVGSVGFWYFVWTPAIQNKQAAIESRMQRLIWIGWIFLGVMNIVTLLRQVATAADISFFQAILDPALIQVVTATQFGTLWITRVLMWIGFGIVLYSEKQTKRRLHWLALILGGAILFTQSLYSHASGAHDPLASVLSDWLHLAATALWVGGLVQFVNVIGPVYRGSASGLPTLSTLVGYFSNFARVAVISLIITGFYAAWLHVGSIEALLSTQYGQALMVKLILVLPLIGIAGINLIFTDRGLRAGTLVWAGRLRALVSTEIALTVFVLAVVGVMTAIEPGRSTFDIRNPPTTPPNPYSQTQSADDMRIQLDFTPGWIGQNSFTIKLSDLQGNTVTNASLIRLRFENETQSLGQSELRLENQGDGTYTAAGANISTPGTWRIRTNIQRPDKFDTVIDFSPQVSAAPMAASRVDVSAPLPGRIPIFGLVGILALAMSGFFIVQERRHLSSGSGVLSFGLMIVGAAFLVSALVSILRPGTNSTGPDILTLASPSRILWGVLIIGNGALVLYWVPRLRKIRQLAGIAGLLVGMVFMLLGVGAIFSAFEVTTGAVILNPVPADAASLTRGKTIYESTCLACHGVKGRGDGPLSASINPPPADLQVHMAAGHSDTQLIFWITNGVEGTPMPAFGTRLSEQERWDVLNYIRTFAQP